LEGLFFALLNDFPLKGLLGWRLNGRRPLYRLKGGLLLNGGLFVLLVEVY
jgi:hypothetical protein